MRIAIVYNEPLPSRYDSIGETSAVLGVLNAVKAANRALSELGHYVTYIPLRPPLDESIANLISLDSDLVFNLFEGFCGYPETEASLPEILTELGVPFTGCQDSLIKLALDKAKMKVILRSHGIPTPDFQLLTPRKLPKFRLNYPCIVKPRSEDASHGITEASVVNDFTSLAKQVAIVSECYCGQALVEELVHGREFNATFLGDGYGIILPVSEIVYSLPHDKPKILTFKDKWDIDTEDSSPINVVCPAEIKETENKSIHKMAHLIFQLLGCHGYSRVDMRMDEHGRLFFLEVNPNPDISPDSGAARQAKAAGMNYTQFIDKIIKLALN